MALSGSKSVSFTDWDTLRFSWSATQSVANNSSTVSWKLDLVSGKYGEIISSGTKAYTIVVDGNTYTGKVSIAIGNKTTRTLVSGTTVVNHDENGKKTFNYSFNQTIKIYFSDEYIGSCSGSGSGVLDDIPRYATLVNAPDFRNTSIPQIQISNPLGEDIEELKACIALDEAGTNIAVAWQNIPKDDIYYLYSISTSEREKLAKAVVGSTSTNIWYIISSTIGGVAKTSKLKRAYFIENAKPSLSYSVYDGNSTTSALTGNSSKFIRFYSKLNFTLNAYGREYATITSKSTTYQGATNTSGSGSFTGIESNIITFSATDNRNQTTTENLELDIIEYIKLTCNLKVENPTAAGDASISINGNCFNGSFGARSNSISISYRVKPDGGSYGAWQSISATKSGNSYSATGTITGLDYQTAYTVEARAVDALSSVPSKEVVIKSIPSFDWGKDDFNFNVDIKMNGNTVLRATDEKKVVLSAEGADIYLRPNGSTTDDGQLRITTQGEAYLDGRRMATVEDIPEPAPVPADYIIEQGDTGAYGYIKWASGRFEAWRTSTSSVSVNINSALYGQMYYGTEEQSVTTSGNAAQFVKIHDVQLTLLTVPGMAYPVLRSLSVTDTGAAKATYYVANPLKATITVTPKVHFIGTWK